MPKMASKRWFFCIVASLIVILSDCAPKKGKRGDNFPQTVYDQKQTGDYNIQLHLKDFQIIALLGDDSGNFGDYDYTYDYSDFTIKPVTQKPSESSISSIPTIAPSSSAKPSTTSKPPQSYPTISTSTEKLSPIPINLEEKPVLNEPPQLGNKPHTPGPSAIFEKPQISDQLTINEKPLLVESPSNLIAEVNKTVSNTSTTQKTSKLDDVSSPGKIKVQIIETPVRTGIVPGEDLPEQNEALPQGEILHLRRCATGFTRDKRGRCRRVRRPGNIQQQIPFGFSRLASNLASRLRQTSEENSASSSESKED